MTEIAPCLRPDDLRRRPKTEQARAVMSAGVRRALAEGRGHQGPESERVLRRRHPASFIKVQELCDRIVDYWRSRGYHGIAAAPRIAILDDQDSRYSKYRSKDIWEIETNIGADGYPPRYPA
jgi:hypothetical protein